MSTKAELYEFANNLNLKAGEWMLQKRRRSVDDEWVLFHAPLTNSLSWKMKLWGKVLRIVPFLEDL